MQQRYCDPMSGRCLSVDPVTVYGNGDLRLFNRYAYAFNSPYTFYDPDGRCPNSFCEFLIAPDFVDTYEPLAAFVGGDGLPGDVQHGAQAAPWVRPWASRGVARHSHAGQAKGECGSTGRSAGSPDRFRGPAEGST